jgi:hypothetical protein
MSIMGFQLGLALSLLASNDFLGIVLKDARLNDEICFLLHHSSLILALCRSRPTIGDDRFEIRK